MSPLDRLPFHLVNGVSEQDISNNKFKIYAHVCKKGMYVGRSHDPVKRWQEHWSDAFNKYCENYTDRFRVAIREYQNSFKHYILAVANFENAAKRKEAEAIRFYKASLNVRPEPSLDKGGFGYKALGVQISKQVVLDKNKLSGAWYSRTDEHRKLAIARVYTERSRKRLISVKNENFDSGMKVECPRDEREKFKDGDLVEVYAAISEQGGTKYLVSAKSAVLTLVKER